MGCTKETGLGVLSRLRKYATMRSMSTHPDLITTAEAADLLGRSVATVNRWADDGKLPHAHKIDGLRGPRLFRRDDVLALVRPQPTEAAS